MLYCVSKGEIKMKAKKLSNFQAVTAVTTLAFGGALFSGCTPAYRPGPGDGGQNPPKQGEQCEVRDVQKEIPGISDIPRPLAVFLVNSYKSGRMTFEQVCEIVQKEITKRKVESQSKALERATR